MTEHYNDGLKRGATSKPAQIPLFTTIAALILRFVYLVQVGTYFKERDPCKIKIESKKGEVPTLNATPFKASVD